MSEINGIYAASVSILDKNLRLNISKTIKHAENLIDKGDIFFYNSVQTDRMIGISNRVKVIFSRPIWHLEEGLSN